MWRKGWWNVYSNYYTRYEGRLPYLVECTTRTLTAGLSTRGIRGNWFSLSQQTLYTYAQKRRHGFFSKSTGKILAENIRSLSRRCSQRLTRWPSTLMDFTMASSLKTVNEKRQGKEEVCDETFSTAEPTTLRNRQEDVLKQEGKNLPLRGSTEVTWQQEAGALGVENGENDQETHDVTKI